MFRPPIIRRSARDERGFTLLEVIVTLILLSAVLTVIGSLVVQSHRRIQLSQQRRMAQYALGNTLERLSARPWDQIPQAAGDGLEMPSDLAGRLPGAELRIAVDENDAGDVYRVLAEITWRDHSRQPVTPERLVTWIHRDGRRE